LPRDLDLETVRVIARAVGNLPTNFGVYGTLRLMDQHLSDAPRNIATLTFDLGGHGAVGDTGIRAPSMYQV